MPIDLAAVSWFYVAVLGVFVFVATLIGNLLSFHHRGWAAFLSALVFVVMFVFWTYYPHHLPLPTAITVQKATVAPASPVAPPAPSTPVRPRNPVTDITPPANQ
jgi:cytochrome bd-type quinol oxidase subunit 2